MIRNVEKLSHRNMAKVPRRLLLANLILEISKSMVLTLFKLAKYGAPVSQSKRHVKTPYLVGIEDISPDILLGVLWRH